MEKERDIQEVQDSVEQLKLQLAEGSEIVSQYAGRVLEIEVVPGQVVNAGKQIAKIQVEDYDAELQSVVYFADKDGKKIEKGMNAQVTPSITEKEEHGGIIGTVTEVSAFPVTAESVATIVGNEELAKKLVTGNAAPVQVFIDLEENTKNRSGYLWSASSDPNFELSSGTTTEVSVAIGEVAPISYLIPMFRSWTGIN